MTHAEYMRAYRARDLQAAREYWRELRERPILPEHLSGASPRFWSKVSKGDSCWEWTGQIHSLGYGYFTLRQHKILAHRFAYEDTRGSIPEGMTIDHLCRNRRCVNPDHLEVVSNRENTLRGVSPSALNARKTACKYGHPFDRVWGVRGDRVCSTCSTDRQRRRRARPAQLSAWEKWA